MEVSRIVLFEFHGLSFFILVDVITFKIFQDFLDFSLVFIIQHNWLFFLFLLFVGFNFDTSFGNERLKRDLLGNFDDLGSVSLHGNVEHSCINVGGRLNELNMDLVVEIKLQSSRNSL